MQLEANGSTALIGYSTGREGTQRINCAIEDAWAEILRDPAALGVVSQALGRSPAETRALLPHSPFFVKPGEAGIGAVGTALVAFASAVAYDLAKEATKDAAKAGGKATARLVLRKLWEKDVKPRAEKKLPIRGIGEKTRVFDDVQ